MTPPRPDPARVAALLHERWAEELEEGERFEVTIDEKDGRTSVTVALLAGATRSEFSVVAAGTSASSFDLAVDAADALVGEWLEGGRPALRGVPETRALRGADLQVVTRTRRLDLEAEADRLLGEDA